MRLSIERSALLKALGHVQNVVERRNTIPILSNVLMSAEDGLLTLVATDLDIEVSEATQADISAPGQVTAPAHTLYDIARKLPDGSQVVLQINADDRLDVDAGRSHFTLPLLPSGDFPKMTADGFTHEFAIPAKDLSRLIDKTRFAISTEETRYYLNGIYVHGHDGKLRAVATDGHRLALAESPAPKGAGDMPGVIIPRKTVVDRVATISAEKSRSVKLSLAEHNLSLTVNNPESGNANEDLPVDYAADPLEIGFNAKYLLDVAGQIEGRDATFFLDNPAAPALVKDSEDEHALFVLMPLRV